MTKAFAASGVLALFTLLAGSSNAAGPQDAPACPMKQLKQGYYCEKDSAIVEAKDVKRNKHVGCDSPAIKVRLCTPKLYKCAGADDKDCKMVALKAGRCKCRKPLKLFEDKPSVLQYVCSGCDAKGFNRTKLEHDKEKDKAAKKKAIKLVCDHGSAQN